MAEAAAPRAPAPAGRRATEGERLRRRCCKKEFKPQDRRRPRARSRAPCARWPSRRWRDTSVDLATTRSSRSRRSSPQLDQKLTEQINLILHHEDFQKLEGAWRGLHYLVNNTETDEMLKIRVMNISKKDLRQDAEEVQGHGLGPEPALQEDLRGGVRPVRRRALRLPRRRLLLRPQPARRRAAAARWPRSPPPRTRRSSPAAAPDADADGVVAGAGQSARPDQDLPRRRSTPPGARCASRRTRATSAWRCRASWRACPTAPRPTRSRSSTSRRTPTAPTTASTPGPTPPTRWRVNINRSFKLYGWCSRIRGIESGGAVEGLPVHTFPTDDGGVDMKCPTEIAISDRREAELAKNGFMPLIHRKNSDFAAFIGAQSLQKPAEYDDPDATANANLAARLPYLFATCRFAHYLKCIVRDKIGSFKERDDMQTLAATTGSCKYVDGDPANSSRRRPRRSKPLAAAEVVVEEVEGNPGYYTSKFFLRPHYQLEGLTVSLRLVSKLPSAEGGLTAIPAAASPSGAGGHSTPRGALSMSTDITHQVRRRRRRIHAQGPQGRDRSAVVDLGRQPAVGRRPAAARARARRRPQDFTFTHLYDKASPVLAKQCASGKHFKDCQAHRAQGRRRPEGLSRRDHEGGLHHQRAARRRQRRRHHRAA